MSRSKLILKQLLLNACFSASYLQGAYIVFILKRFEINYMYNIFVHAWAYAWHGIWSGILTSFMEYLLCLCVAALNKPCLNSYVRTDQIITRRQWGCMNRACGLFWLTDFESIPFTKHDNLIELLDQYTGGGGYWHWLTSTYNGQVHLCVFCWWTWVNKFMLN